MIKYLRPKVEAPRGSDIEQPVEISLEEAYKGTRRLFEIRTTRVCPVCKGSRKLWWFWSCKKCTGQGEVPYVHRIEVNIPPGVRTGTRIRIPGEGTPASQGGERGDLFLVLDLRPDPDFELKGDNLYVDASIEWEKGMNGGRIPITTPDKRILSLSLPPGTTQDRTFCLFNQGMPRLHGKGKGDLFVRVKILAQPVSTGSVRTSHTNVGPMTSNQASLPSLGNYRFIRLLGAGGFADVYLAEHIFLKTQAAIKVMRKTTVPHNLQVFLREAQIIASFRHPSIIRILDFGVEETIPFLVMEFASEGTLRDRHPEHSILPVSTIGPYITQMASALAYAHEQKLVHRDIKPENMLVDAGDRIMLSDFGIAITSHSTLSMTAQEAVGTISYMAPEQIQGRALPASDQYALAAVVYEWLSGEPLFDGQTSIEIAMKHLSEPPASLREKIPDLPHEIEQIVFKALEKQPDRRFESITAFASNFNKAIKGIK